MEAVSLHGSWDNRKSHVRSSEKSIHQSFVSRSYDYNHFPPPSNYFHSMGSQQTPPPRFLQHHHLRPPPQPPLLPLPSTQPHLTSAGRALSLPPANKNSYRSREISFTPKKSKSPNKNPKIRKSAKVVGSQGALVSASSSSDPFNITATDDNARGVEAAIRINHEDFYGSKIYTTSPSPSSLPMPSFCLRPKLRCSAAAAAGGDTGATDNLQRLLQLQ